jgi:glycosyltransferase involved in cell wall biosynthesis
MKCLHIASGDTWAGAEVSLLNTVRELAGRSGVTVSAIVLNHGVLARQLAAIPVETWVIEEGRLDLGRLITRCSKRIRDAAVEIIHSHRYKENLIGAVLAARHGLLHVRTAHGLPPQLGVGINRASIAALADGALASWLGSTWVAVSNDLGGRLGGLRRTVHVIPNGLPATPPVACRAVLDQLFESETPAWYVGYVGRMEAVKRPDRFLRVVAMLPRHLRGREVRAVMLGEGSLRSQVERSIEDRPGSPPVRVLGQREDGDSVVAALDVLLLPSDHEGLPMVMLEAMRSGVPFAGTAVGGVAEVLGPVPWLVPTDREDRLAAAVLRLLDTEGARWSTALRRLFLERFTIDRTVDRLLQVYRSGLRSSSGSRHR